MAIKTKKGDVFMSMSLKESFRYQKFLDELLCKAQLSLTNRSHALKTTKIHKRNAANPDAVDITEEVAVEDFFPNDCIIFFIMHLTEAKESLCKAIREAKSKIGFDIDAAIEVNKYRQSLRAAINSMLNCKAATRAERGTDYKFNVEGNQVQYMYDVDVVQVEAYDRDRAKQIMKAVIRKADEVSRAIDEAVVTTMVDFDAPYDVNDSFEEAVGAYLCSEA